MKVIVGRRKADDAGQRGDSCKSEVPEKSWVGVGSRAQVKGPVLDQVILLAAKKAEYVYTNVDTLVDLVLGVCRS